jgi:putative transcriptional regulator
MRVGPKVRDLRKAMGWTQGDLSDELQVSKPWVSRLELGTVKPSLDRIIQIADLFDTTPDALLGEPWP